jgi:hypothetical protein
MNENKQNTTVRTSMQTRFLVWVGIGCIRASPLIALAIYSRRADVQPIWWVQALAAALAIQLLFFFVERRSSGSAASYHHGLQFIGACVSTGWSYFDAFLIVASVIVFHILSLAIAVAPNARELNNRLLNTFYRHRLEQ